MLFHSGLTKAVVAVISTAGLLISASTVQAMENFQRAKKELPGIYQTLDKEFGNTSTIYCGCDLSYSGGGKRVKWQLDLDSCGYEARKNAERASRIEAEHVMPAWDFGHQLKCWQKGGRKECAKDDSFRQMEGDLHNLYPSVGEVNGDRGNFRFTDWNGKPNQYGKCEMVVDFKDKRAQPPKRARGQIARAYLYMADQYDIRLATQQRKLYEAWDKAYPVTQLDCRRNELIQKIQGNDNKFITEACKLQKQSPDQMQNNDNSSKATDKQEKIDVIKEATRSLLDGIFS